MSKMKINTAIAAAATLAMLAPAALPTAAMAQSRSNGITSCDAPGGRQQAGAIIGGILGAVAGSQISRNERGLGAVAGGAAGAAAGSYIGCNQQRGRAGSSDYSYGNQNGEQVRATANVNVRSGPGTGYSVVSRLSAGQPVTATGSQGDWVQIAGGGWVSARYLSY